MDRGVTGITSVPPERDRTKPLIVRPSREAEALARVVATLGQSGFLGEFARACEVLFAADQVTSFFIEPRRVRCVLAHRPKGQRLVEGLCRDYARAWHARDPLLALGGADPFEVRAVEAEEIPDEGYRTRLFAAADLGGKIAIIARERQRTLYWNLYFRRRAAGAMSRAAAVLAGSGAVLAQALHKHDALTGAAEVEAVTRLQGLLGELCPALSAREREVLARIASGQSVARIAAALGIGEQSVMTFRGRGYAKLGISGRGELFARCAGVAL